MKQKLQKFLSQVRSYSGCEISANGEATPWSTSDLTDHALAVLSDEEISRLGLLLESGETSQVMEFLTYNCTDFNFNFGGES